MIYVCFFNYNQLDLRCIKKTIVFLIRFLYKIFCFGHVKKSAAQRLFLLDFRFGENIIFDSACSSCNVPASEYCTYRQYIPAEK